MAKFLESLLRFKDIVWYRTLAQLKAESKNNYLGYAWFVLEPLISTAILYLVFGVIMGDRGSEMALFILIGMMLWQWMESSVMLGINGIREKFGILNTVKIPKFLFPLVSVLTNTWKFCCVYIVMLFFCNIFGFYVNAAYLMLPMVLFSQLIFIAGLTMPLAIFVTYMPDLINLISSLFRLMFFLSGIFYSLDRVPEALAPYFYCNPIAALMQANREILLYGRFPDVSLWLMPALVGTLLLLFGLYLSFRVEQTLLKRVSN